MPTQRQERVGQLLRDEISRIVQRGMRDPRLGLVTLTEVEVSADLRQARVYVSVYGDEETVRQTVEALSGAAGYIRVELSRAVKLRYIPELTFHYDDSLARGARVLELMEKLKHEQAGQDNE
jgi:ribosome-binding factor A